MRFKFDWRMISLQRKICLIVISGFSVLALFAEVPNGAKETFHLKIEQENRFCLSSYQKITPTNSATSLEINRSNGVLLEIAVKQFTLGATFLDEARTNSGLSKLDLDLGYEHYLTKTLNLQPFVGCEMNEIGPGFTMGAKLNKNIELFDYFSLGLFAGLRYSTIEINNDSYSNRDISHGYLGGSIGVYGMIYNYRRPKIRRNW
ncbi:MAG: hypothetical protein Q8904_15245 [Bacteroidota bacterium]|nr:hypothetical protein [Bacteroidota bacterium]